MKLVIQRVNHCKLSVGDEIISEINKGLLVFVGVHKLDTLATADYLARKVASLRIFKDENNKTNKSVIDENGEVLVVSNFTLLGELPSGTRPSFSNGANGETANMLYLRLAEQINKNGVNIVKTGKFKSHMHLDCSLDGPFTILLER